MFPTRLSFLTYNLWNTQRWPDREPALRAFFRRYRPDVFCLQELRLQTRTALEDALPDYRRVEDDFPGWEKESNIFWNAGLLEEVEHGVEDILIESDEFRGLFWARLRVRATGQQFFVSTAHYTYQEHPAEMQTGQSPRLAQARATIQALREKVQENEPAFFMGDFNDPVVPTLLLAEAGYRSCFIPLGLVPPPTWPCFPTANIVDWERLTNESIDWIVANDRARPIAALVPHFYHGDIAPSDHWPVMAIYEIAGD